MSNVFVTIKMCYVYNQWYDISWATLYVVSFGINCHRPKHVAVLETQSLFKCTCVLSAQILFIIMSYSCFSHISFQIYKLLLLTSQNSVWKVAFGMSVFG